jgi:hypothetical protein
MAEWGQLKRDALAGMATLTTSLANAAHRAGREVALVESRATLFRLERELARRYRALGEAAYEEWRRAGARAFEERTIGERVDEIAELVAQRDRLRRELSESDADWPPTGGADG